MSVNLMELKVPDNAPRALRDQINIGLTFRQTTGMANRWVEICAVAALYWREYASREVLGRAEYAYAKQQADLWQRAAFEGVEQ